MNHVFYLILILFLLLTFFVVHFLGESIFDYYKNWHRAFSRKINAIKMDNVFFEIWRGEKLLLEIIFWAQQSNLGIMTKGERIFTPFKYYSKLLSDLVYLEQTFGVIVSEYLNEIRKCLLRDLNFEKKKKHELINAFLQMVFMSLIVFSFIFLVESQIEIQIPSWLKLALLFWQFLGGILFSVLNHYLEKQIFGIYFHFFLLLYDLRALESLGLPSENGFRKFEHFKIKFEGKISSKFHFELLRLQNLLIAQRDKGMSIHQELQEMQLSLYEIRDFELEKYQKRLSLSKFLVLALFFLSTYLVFVFYLFSFFME